MQADAAFWDSLVFDGIDDVDVEAVTVAFCAVDVVGRGRETGAACPDCGGFSNRVHDCCQRRLKDLPLSGQSVVITLTARRFICGSEDCVRRTFAEPFAQGCTSATQLHRELLAGHAPVTYRMVRAHIATLRSPPGSTPSTPANCPASPASRSTCFATWMS
ncbi:transposase family protein [Streptomyces populi]|uniref:transposase family protein n=1 Tax=Streptomyces populi TaxID=2058924 RepID=UPI003B848B87